MSLYKQLEIEWMKTYKKRMLSGEISLCEASKYNKYFKTNDILQNFHLKWDWYNISYELITIDLVKKDIGKNWNWYAISGKMKLSEIENNMHVPWRWGSISENKNLTILFVKKYVDKNWNWACVSQNLSISPSDIMNDMHLPWDFTAMSMRNDVCKIIMKYPTEKWHWSYVLHDTNDKFDLTFDFFEKFKHLIDSRYYKKFHEKMLNRDRENFIESWTTKYALIMILEQCEQHTHGCVFKYAVFSDSFIVKTVMDFL